MSGFGGNNFYSYGLFHLYIAIFGKLFDGLEVQRRDNNGKLIQVLPVPIGYGNRSKWYQKIKQDPNSAETISHQLPRLSFELVGIEYDRSLQTSPLKYQTNIVTNQDVYRQFKPVIYNFYFSLYVIAKNEADNFQILENILPFFTPDFSFKISPIPNMNYRDDCTIEFLNCTYEQDSEGKLDTSREMSWVLNFKMRVKLYGPIQHVGLIKKVQIDFLIPHGNSQEITNEDLTNVPVAVRLETTPGMTANNQPTTDPTKTIPYNQIHIDDPWTYIQKLFEYNV